MMMEVWFEVTMSSEPMHSDTDEFDDSDVRLQSSEFRPWMATKFTLNVQEKLTGLFMLNKP